MRPPTRGQFRRHLRRASYSTGFQNLSKEARWQFLANVISCKRHHRGTNVVVGDPHASETVETATFGDYKVARVNSEDGVIALQHAGRWYYLLGDEMASAIHTMAVGESLRGYLDAVLAAHPN